MLDVDGQVISSEELILRVEQLLVTIDTGGVPASLGTPPSGVPLDAPIKGMQAAHSQLHPPELGAPKGLRGRVGAVVKRVVRKLTSWYVEPRWALQQELDSQHIAFAELVADAARTIDAELDDLRLQSTRLKLQAVALGERLNRNVAETDDLVVVVSKYDGILAEVAMRDELRPVAREVNALVEPIGVDRRNRCGHRLRGVRGSLPGELGGCREGAGPLSFALPAGVRAGHGRRHRLRTR